MMQQRAPGMDLHQSEEENVEIVPFSTTQPLFSKHTTSIPLTAFLQALAEIVAQVEWICTSNQSTQQQMAWKTKKGMLCIFSAKTSPLRHHQLIFHGETDTREMQYWEGPNKEVVLFEKLLFYLAFCFVILDSLVGLCDSNSLRRTHRVMDLSSIFYLKSVHLECTGTFQPSQPPW